MSDTVSLAAASANSFRRLGVPEAAALRQEVAEANWDSVERYGGLNTALKKMNEFAQESPVSIAGGMIDDFRLQGVKAVPSGGVRLTNVGSDTQAGHDFNDHNASLSEGDFPRHCGLGIIRNSVLEAEQHGVPASLAAKRSAAAPCVSPSCPARRRAARGGVLVVGATPIF